MKKRLPLLVLSCVLATGVLSSCNLLNLLVGGVGGSAPRRPHGAEVNGDHDHDRVHVLDGLGGCHHVQAVS